MIMPLPALVEAGKAVDRHDVSPLRLHVEQGDVTWLPFAETHFDAAMSTHSDLAEIRRVLRPGGRFLMVVWVPGWITFSLADVACAAPTSRAAWRGLAGEAGFTLRDESIFSGM